MCQKKVILCTTLNLIFSKGHIFAQLWSSISFKICVSNPKVLTETCRGFLGIQLLYKSDWSVIHDFWEVCLINCCYFGVDERCLNRLVLVVLAKRQSGPHMLYRTTTRHPGWTVFEAPSTRTVYQTPSAT